MSPFVGWHWDFLPPPEDTDPARWEAYREAVNEQILASNNYDDLETGPQLLDTHARPNRIYAMQVLVGTRGLTTNASQQPYVIRRRMIDGLTPEEMFAAVPGARQGLANIVLQSEAAARDPFMDHQHTSLEVMVRARRSKHPGIVFARAAASGEVDPLEDVENRLIVG